MESSPNICNRNTGVTLYSYRLYVKHRYYYGVPVYGFMLNKYVVYSSAAGLAKRNLCLSNPPVSRHAGQVVTGFHLFVWRIPQDDPCLSNPLLSCHAAQVATGLSIAAYLLLIYAASLLPKNLNRNTSNSVT
jgi:hypothetical protein